MHLDLAPLLSEAKGKLRFYKNEVLMDMLYYGWLARTGFLSGVAYQMVNNIPARGVSTTMTTEKVKESTDVNVARC